MFKYSIRLEWSNEDAAYVATIPEFPGLSALADTPHDAVEQAQVAAELFIEDMKADGEPVPEPAVKQDYSGQLRVRLPKSLHARLAQSANMDTVSLNTYIIHLLSERQSALETAEKLCSHIDEAMAQMWSASMNSTWVRVSREEKTDPPHAHQDVSIVSYQ